MAQTKTIAERLERPQQLNSTVRSYSYGEYAEKRANYVGFDKYGAGADWGNLAKALDGFYSEFRHYANDVYLPQWKERGIAEGQEKYNAHSETEGYTKNRLAFKEFVEQHPEMASNNPWVKVGYEQARLNTLSMEMENGLQQAMVENGLMNEEDETKVQQFARNYMKHFKDEAGLSGYEDSVLLAKNFGSKEAQIFDGAMDRYLRVKNQQMQEKLADATIKEGVAVITNMLNGKSSQGLDPDLPENIDSKNIIEVLKGIAERQAGNGLLDSKGKDVVWGMIRSAYAQTNNRNVLKLTENAMFKDMKIIDDPQIAEWYHRTWEHIRNEDARKAREARADADQKKAWQINNLSLAIAKELKDQGKPATYDTITEALKAKGIAEDNRWFAQGFSHVSTFMGTLGRQSKLSDVELYKMEQYVMETSPNKESAAEQLTQNGLALDEPRLLEAADRINRSSTQEHQQEFKLLTTALTSIDSFASDKAEDFIKGDAKAREALGDKDKTQSISVAAHDQMIRKIKQESQNIIRNELAQLDRSIPYSERLKQARLNAEPKIVSMAGAIYTQYRDNGILYSAPLDVNGADGQPTNMNINDITGAYALGADDPRSNAPLNTVEIDMFNRKYADVLSKNNMVLAGIVTRKEAIDFLQEYVYGGDRTIAAQQFVLLGSKANTRIKQTAEEKAKTQQEEARAELQSKVDEITESQMN